MSIRWSRGLALIGTLSVPLALTGCKHQQRDMMAFGQAYGQAGFSPKQCAFLYVMHRDARDDADMNYALALTGLSATMSNAALNNSRR